MPATANFCKFCIIFVSGYRNIAVAGKSFARHCCETNQWWVLLRCPPLLTFITRANLKELMCGGSYLQPATSDIFAVTGCTFLPATATFPI